MLEEQISSIKTVVISLKESRERRSKFIKELHNLKLHNYLFYDAVEGNALQISPVFGDRIFNINDPSRNNHYFYDKYKRINGAGLGRGELGCLLSHMNVWNRLVSDIVYSYYLIFEDDFTSNTQPEIIQKYLENLPPTDSFDIIHLSVSDWFPFEKEKQITELYYKPQKKFFNRLTGYILTKTGAMKLLNSCHPLIGLPADDVVSNLYIFGGDSLRLLVPNETLFKEVGLESDIQRINNLP